MKPTLPLEDLPPQALFEATKQLLFVKGIMDEAGVAARAAWIAESTPARGRRMVARAWLDEDYRRLMVTNGSAAAEALGIPMKGQPPLGVIENTPQHHHLIVCTLCSCYPRAVLGMPPFWYKSAAFRSRAIREPRHLLREEWGTVIPEGTSVRVLDSTADFRWMVLPLRPAGTDGWSEEALMSIVKDGDMLGITRPSADAPADSSKLST